VLEAVERLLWGSLLMELELNMPTLTSVKPTRPLGLPMYTTTHRPREPLTKNAKELVDEATSEGAWETTFLYKITRDKQFRKVFDYALCIAGGAVRDALVGKTTVSDVDIYFTDEDTYNSAIELMEGIEGAARGYETESSITWHYLDNKLQFVKPDTHPTSSIGHLLIEFDIDVCQFAYMHGDLIAYYDYSLDALVKRQFKVSKVRDPVKSMYRIQKYMKYGFTISQKDIYHFLVTSVEVIEGDPDRLKFPSGNDY